MRHGSDMTIPATSLPSGAESDGGVHDSPYYSHYYSLVAVLGEEKLKLQSWCWEKEFEWGPGCQKVRNDEQLKTHPEEIGDSSKQDHVKLQNPSADFIVPSNFT